MKPSEFNRSKVVEIVTRNVSGLPIYQEGQRIDARLIAGGVIWACYAPIPHRDDSIRTSFHLNFEGEICYLAGINLAEKLRGKGIGESMYRAVERIAREMGCDRVRQEPDGESRRDYLKRKFGYVNVIPTSKVGEVEKLLV